MNNKKTNKIKKPIVEDKEDFVEEESNKTAIILLCLGIFLVIGLIIGTISYLNSTTKKEEKEKNKEIPEVEVIKEKEDKVVETPVKEETTVKGIVYAPAETKYIVEFYSNQVLIKTEKVKSGSNISCPSLSLTNQRFLYWYYLDGNNNEVVFNFNSDTINNDLKLYAKLINTYTVEFLDENDVVITDSQTLDQGSFIEALDEDDLVKNFGTNEYKKVFTWYKDKNFTNLYDFETPVTENLILYGKYEDVYRVTFRLEEVEDNSTYVGAERYKYVKPNEKVEFLNYFYDGKYVKSWDEYNKVTDEIIVDFDFNEPITENKILVPYYGYKLTYDTDGGNEMDSIVTYMNLFIPEPETPVKSGYKFSKWVFEDGTDVDFGRNIMTNNITIKALWTPAVTFETNGGTAIDPIIPTEGKISVPETTKQGYTFDGWYYDEELTEVVEIANDIFEVPEILYAKWNANNITLTYDLNGGVNSVDPGNNKTQTAKTDEEITLFDGSTYSKTTAELDGWSKIIDGEVEYELGEEIVMPNINTIVYAKWTNLHKLTINLNAIDATNPLNTPIELSKREAEAIGNISLEGIVNPNHTVKELNTKSDGTGITVTNEMLMANTDMTIYIIWELTI